MLTGFFFKSQYGYVYLPRPCKRENTALWYNFYSSYQAPQTWGWECFQTLLYMAPAAAYTYCYKSRKILISFLAITRKFFTPSTAQKSSGFLTSQLSVYSQDMRIKHLRPKWYSIWRRHTSKKEVVWEIIVSMREFRGSWLYVTTQKIHFQSFIWDLDPILEGRLVLQSSFRHCLLVSKWNMKSTFSWIQDLDNSYNMYPKS